MNKLLYIQCSPRSERSRSKKIADAFVTAYRDIHPDDRIESVNLFQIELPTFDGFTIDAKYKIMHGQKHSREESAAWKAVESIIERFKSADKYVLAVPMWNFGIPYRLKQYIDILVQPGYTFNAGEKGYQGLVTGRPALVVYASGGQYKPGGETEAYDMQKPYIELILRFMGFENIQSLIYDSTLMSDPDEILKIESGLIKKAKDIAVNF